MGRDQKSFRQYVGQDIYSGSYTGCDWDIEVERMMQGLGDRLVLERLMRAI